MIEVVAKYIYKGDQSDSDYAKKLQQATDYVKKLQEVKADKQGRKRSRYVQELWTSA